LSLNFLLPRAHTGIGIHDQPDEMESEALIDPELPVELSEVQRQLSEWSGRTGRQPSAIISVDAVSGCD